MPPEKKKTSKHLTEQQLLFKIQQYCAYQERCQKEVRTKLYELGMFSEQAENIIAELISDNFINEERFAKLYAGGKFRIKKWGRLKIEKALKQFEISDYCINKGMAEISFNDYYKTLQKIIEEKEHSIKESNSYKKKNKIAQYAISRGYEAELVWEILNDIEGNQ